MRGGVDLVFFDCELAPAEPDDTVVVGHDESKSRLRRTVSKN